MCLAAVSALCDVVEGRSVAATRELVARFVKMVDDGAVADGIGDLAALAPVSAFPARRGCATLASDVLLRALEGC